MATTRTRPAGQRPEAPPGRREEGPSGPESPTELPARSWRRVLKAAIGGFRDDGATDWAAALTYYAVLSLFPGVLVLIALLGVLGQHPQTTNAMLDIVRDIGPASAVDTLADPIEQVTTSGAGAGALLGVGLLGALWGASGYIGAFARAANAIHGVEEDRPFWKLRPQQLAVTIVMLVILTALLVGLVVSGPLAGAVGDAIGLGDAAVTAWGIAKWPLLVLMVAFLLAILYHWAPNVARPRFRWLTPGAILAVVVWIAASAAFGFYVANFGSYNATYGALAGAIIFLLWIWITQIAILLGLEVNVELDRERRIQDPETPTAAPER